MRLAGLVLVALIAIGLPGCAGQRDDGIATAGGDQGAIPAMPGPSPATDPAQRRRQYAECLRQHGVDVGDPDQGKGVEVRSTDEQTAKAAARACQRYATNVAGSKGGTEIARLRDYGSCMRQNGVVGFPDPDPSGGLVIPKSILNSPEFAAANRVCDAAVAKPGVSGTR